MGERTLRDVRNGLDLLSRWEKQRWHDVVRCARDIAPLVWAELKERELWDSLPPQEQAALYLTLCQGRALSLMWSESKKAHVALRVRQLAGAVAYFAAHCDRNQLQWPEARPDRREQSRAAAGLYAAFDALPAMWRPEVLRRATVPAPATGPWPPAGPLPEVMPPSRSIPWAAQRAHKGAQPPQRPVLADDRTPRNAMRLCRRFHLLPEAWRIELLRRIEEGADASHATCEAMACVNTLHGVFAISLAWCAEASPATVTCPRPLAP